MDFDWLNAGNNFLYETVLFSVCSLSLSTEGAILFNWVDHVTLHGGFYSPLTGKIPLNHKICLLSPWQDSIMVSPAVIYHLPFESISLLFGLGLSCLKWTNTYQRTTKHQKVSFMKLHSWARPAVQMYSLTIVWKLKPLVTYFTRMQGQIAVLQVQSQGHKT